MCDGDKIYKIPSLIGIGATEDYLGEFNSSNQKHGDGCEIWDKDYLQKYYGKFLYDNMHNEGVYSQIKNDENYIYEGSIYVNKFEGYSRVIISNCTYFEGLFKNNKRFGPGVLTYENGFQDVGLWNGLNIIRLSKVVLPHWIPTLGLSQIAKIKLLKHRKLVRVCNEENIYKAEHLAEIMGLEPELADNLYNQNIRNTKSHFFNKKYYDLDYFGFHDCYIDVVLSSEELLTSYGKLQEIEEPKVKCEEESFLEKEIIAQQIINKLFNNMERFQNCSDEEENLINLKHKILKVLNIQRKKQEEAPKIATKKVLVTDVLAWNNEESCVEMLKHSFFHRNREDIVNFNVANVLTGNRHAFGDPGIYECACIAFLVNCSEGKTTAMRKLCKEFNLNPDLTDSRGNAGIVFAAARDRVAIIKELTQLGANLDIVNDEGLTPLTMCLLRYITILKGIKNWEKAFLLNTSEINEENNNVWFPRASFISLLSHSSFDLVNYNRGLCFKKDHKLMLHDFAAIEEHHNLDEILKALNISRENMSHQHFQTSYEYNPEDPEKYLFATNLIKPKKRKRSPGSEKRSKGSKKSKISKKTRSKSSKKTASKISKKSKKSNKSNRSAGKIKKIPSEILHKLGVIYNTILVLLHYGADANIGEVPLPAIFLALYTDNSEILRKLLESGAKANATCEDNMTALHILATLPASEGLIDLCKVLLEFCDPNVRTAATHWKEEKCNVIGKYNGVVSKDDGGKTPLHILAMRLDYDLDPNGYLNEIARLLITNGCELDQTHLGHSPLSLAMLKGNINLVKTLLENGADPNQILKNEMGTPVTIYVLKRYTKLIPDVNTSKFILDLLIKHYGNPLLPIGNYRNAVEFMQHQEVEVVSRKKGKKKAKKLPKKKAKEAAQKAVKRYLLKLAKDVAFRHYQGKALLAIVNMLFAKQQDEKMTKDIATLLTVDDAAKILQLLIDKNILQLKNDYHYLVMHHVLKFVAKFGYKVIKKRGKSNVPGDVNVSEELSKLKAKQAEPKSINRKIVEFELDPCEKIYKICFYCGLKHDKVLLPCTKCGLVYFCSERCNVLSIKEKTRHVCNVNFYNAERKRYDECMELGIDYLPEQVLKSFRNVKSLLKQMRKNFEKQETSRELFNFGGETFEYPYKNVDSAQEGQYSDEASSKHFDKDGRIVGKFKDKQWDDLDHLGKYFDETSSKNLDKGGKLVAKFKNKDGKTIGSSGYSEKLESGGKGAKHKGNVSFKTQIGKYSKARPISGGSGSSKTSRGYSTRTPKNAKGQAKYLSNKYDSDRSYATPASYGKGVSKNVKKSEIGKTTHEDDGHSGKLPKNYQLFLQKLAEVFPEFDVPALFVPFVCFKEGQLYYRFPDNKAVYCPTYSNV